MVYKWYPVMILKCPSRILLSMSPENILAAVPQNSYDAEERRLYGHAHADFYGLKSRISSTSFAIIIM